MELSKKLQELRKQKGITQDELAKLLFVSRTAISKWESGRGYPSITSLKAIADLFNISIDSLLSGEELILIAEKENKSKQKALCDIVFGLLDISIILFLFVPLFAQKIDNVILEASLLSLLGVSTYIKITYLLFTVFTVIFGIVTLVLQNCNCKFWIKNKCIISVIINIIGIFLFIVTRQPYAASFLFVYLIIKVLMLLKSR